MKPLRIFSYLIMVCLLTLVFAVSLTPQRAVFAQTGDYDSQPVKPATGVANAALAVPVAFTTMNTSANTLVTSGNLVIRDVAPANAAAVLISSIRLVDKSSPNVTFGLEVRDQGAVVQNTIPNDYVPGAPFNLGTGATLTVNVTCLSTTAGTYTVNIQVEANDLPPTSFYKYTVTCNVVAPQYTVTGTNGATLTGTTLTKTIKDIDVAPTIDLGLNIANGAAGGSGANLVATANWVGTPPTQISLVDGPVPYNFSVAPQANDTLDIRCNPAGITTFPTTLSAVLKISHNSPSGVLNSVEVNYTIQCTFEGTATYSLQFNGVTINPTGTIDLGSSPTGLVLTKQLRFNNTGNGILTVEVSESSSAFNFPPPLLSSGTAPTNSIQTRNVPAGNNNILVDVECQPVTATTFQTTLTVKHNALGVPNTPVTYTLQCTGLPPAGIYSDTLSVPQTGATLNLGSAVVNAAPVNANPDLRPSKTAGQPMVIENSGPGFLVIDAASAATFVGDHPNDFGIRGLTNFTIPGLQGSNDVGRSIEVFCAPTAVGTRQATLVVIYSDTVTTGLQKTYNLRCTGLSTALVPATISITASGTAVPLTGGTIPVQSGAAAVPLVIQNGGATGAVDLIINSAVLLNATNFSITGTFPDNVVLGIPETYNLSCTSASTTSTTLTITYSLDGGATTQTASFTVNCSTVPIGVPKISVTSNTGGSSSSVTLSTTVNTKVTSTFTVSNSGTGILTLLKTGSTTVNAEMVNGNPSSSNPIVFDGGSSTTFISPNALASGSSATITVACTPTTAGTYTMTFRIHSNNNGVAGSTTDISLTCTTTTTTTSTPNTTQTASAGSTGTSSAATALPPVSSTSVTPCSSSQVLSTPFPQNASGEFLLVNCYVVNTAGTVNISLSQALTNTGRGVTEAGRSSIQANAGLMSAWRMGSWFLVPDFTYNAATQTYTFTSAAGTNVYVLFYGGITQPVGAQGTTFTGTTTGTTATAGTTTGNIRDIFVDDKRGLPTAAVLSTLVIGLVLVIYAARRFNSQRHTEPNQS